jgi:AcrR family transcriptional regulator
VTERRRESNARAKGSNGDPAESPGTADGQAAPRSTKGAQTRARLLTAAKTVFEDTGFLDARISDIAEAAGLSHGSFYHYFDSKEQIFREIAEAQEALLTAPAPRPERSAGDSDPEVAEDNDGPSQEDDREPSDYERILRSNRRYLERYRDNGKIMAVIEEVSRYDDHVNEVRLQRQKHFASRSEASLRRLQEEGRATADVDPEIAALALGSMVARVAELWLVEHWGDYDLDQISDQVTRLWANAIGLVEEPPGTQPR